MAQEKIQRVNADDITLPYNNQWYCILYPNLVDVIAARERYGLHPEVGLFIELEMLTPHAPILQGQYNRITGEQLYSDEVVYPQPPAMTAEIEKEMRIRLMKRRIQQMNDIIFDDLRAQFDLLQADYADLLTEFLMP